MLLRELFDAQILVVRNLLFRSLPSHVLARVLYLVEFSLLSFIMRVWTRGFFTWLVSLLMVLIIFYLRQIWTLHDWCLLCLVSFRQFECIVRRQCVLWQLMDQYLRLSFIGANVFQIFKNFLLALSCFLSLSRELVWKWRGRFLFTRWFHIRLCWNCWNRSILMLELPIFDSWRN